jgi:serine/threonine protein kinase
MALTVPDFCDLLTRSRLLPAATVQAVARRWQAVARYSSRLEDFSAWLVANQHLTEYQASVLQTGQADNFFFGDYKLLDRVGKGRMAGVYKAVSPNGQVVAIKVLPPSKAKEPQTLGRFQREAKLAMQLNHHSVVRTFHCGEQNGLHYLVMEYLEGETLEALLAERGRLPSKEAVRIGFLALLGLQHIHEKGMIHRDLKPGNLMLCPAPSPLENTLRSMVKILDIGLGRTLFDPMSRDVAGELTTAGAMVGTPDYLAPEQARDASRVDIRADIYSLGCTLYHLLAGKPPFADDNMVRQMLRHATQPPQPLPELNPEVARGLNQIVTTMLAKEPGQRYATPGQAAEALKAFLSTGAR